MKYSSTSSIDEISTELKILMVLLVGECLKIYRKIGQGFVLLNEGLINFISIKNNLFKMSEDISISLKKTITSFTQEYQESVKV